MVTDSYRLRMIGDWFKMSWGKSELEMLFFPIGGVEPGLPIANEIEIPPQNFDLITRENSPDNHLTYQELYQLQSHALSSARKASPRPLLLPIGTQPHLSPQRSQTAYKLQTDILHLETAISKLSSILPSQSFPFLNQLLSEADSNLQIILSRSA